MKPCTKQKHFKFITGSFFSLKSQKTLELGAVYLKIWISKVDFSFHWVKTFVKATNGIRSGRKLAQLYSVLQDSLKKAETERETKL